MLHEPLERLFDWLTVVNAGAVKRDNSRCREWKRSTAALPQGIAKAAVRVLALLYVLNALGADFVRHMKPGVARGAQAHDLADGDREVGIAFDRLVAPAARVVLRGAG